MDQTHEMQDTGLCVCGSLACNATPDKPTQRDIADAIYGAFGLDLGLVLTVSAALQYARESVQAGRFPVDRYGTIVVERLKSMELD